LPSINGSIPRRRDKYTSTPPSATTQRRTSGSATPEMARSTGTLAPTGAPGKPYNLILAVSVVVVSAIVFGVVMYLYRDTFKEAALVTTALSTLFGIFGTVVGAYFGIKSSNDAHDKTRDELARANDTVSRALAALPPSEGRRVVGLEP
jgi:hypothetical protein